MKRQKSKLRLFFVYYMIPGDHTIPIPRSKNIHGATLDTTHVGLSSENPRSYQFKKGS